VQFVDAPDLAARLKEAKGLGTPATRDTIIEGLKRLALLEVEKKKLKAAELAMAVYALLRQEAPEALDPAVTEDIEKRSIDGTGCNDGEERPARARAVGPDHNFSKRTKTYALYTRVNIEDPIFGLICWKAL